MKERRKLIAQLVMPFMLVLGICCSNNLRAQTTKKLVAIPPPPMGWSSWNSFSNIVDSQIVMDQARAMISSAMHKAGYRYINIDEGWWLGTRDAAGNIVVDPNAWPPLAAGERAGDMANIVRFIHGLGLKAGIYTDAGENGCSMYPDLGPKYFHTGSEGHYEQDFLQFAKWGFDYVKVDWCGGDKENLDPAVQYAEIARAIARAEAITGHQLYLSLCEWGKNSPWTWAPNVGGLRADIWRTSGDIVDPIVAGHEHADRKASFEKMLGNFDQGVHPEAEHSGYYNDPDMMVLGMPGLTDEQNRVHMALWAISGAPLLVGADLATLGAGTLATLTNPAVVAIDQDAAGLQGVKVAEPAPGLQVWSKALATPGSRAVLLLNRTPADAAITVTWASIGLDGSAARVVDAWTGKELESAKDSFMGTVGMKDGVLLLISGREEPMAVYHPNPPQQHAIAFNHVQGRGTMARILISYTNPDSAPRFAQLRINGEDVTRIAFPATGNGNAGQIWIQSILPRNGSDNVVTFSDASGAVPVIHSIAVQ